MYPRSALKPMQATAMAELRSRAARRTARHRLRQPRRVRRCTLLPCWTCSPRSGSTSRRCATRRRTRSRRRPGPMRFARGDGPSALQQNCSGKHAGMLATCRVNGWSIDDYLARRTIRCRWRITASIERHGAPVHHVGIDGCGAPTHADRPRTTSPARSPRIARSHADVARSMTAIPIWSAGTTRDVTRWMQRGARPRDAKDGADGVMAAALPDGRAFALKIAGGADGARQSATAEALRVLGVDGRRPRRTGRSVVHADVSGHGHEVGRIDASLDARACRGVPDPRSVDVHVRCGAGGRSARAAGDRREPVEVHVPRHRDLHRRWTRRRGDRSRPAARQPSRRLAPRARGCTVRAILVTHCHADHSPLAAWLTAETGAPTIGFGPHLDDAGTSATIRSNSQPDDRRRTPNLRFRSRRRAAR